MNDYVLTLSFNEAFSVLIDLLEAKISLQEYEIKLVQQPINLIAESMLRYASPPNKLHQRIAEYFGGNMDPCRNRANLFAELQKLFGVIIMGY
jgi:hypothetical protein